MSKRHHNEQSELPSGYTRLQYIASTGTQYIDTGVCVTPDIRVCLGIAWTTVSSNLSNGVQDWNLGIIFRIDQFPQPKGVYIYYGNHTGTFQVASGIGGDTNIHNIDVQNGLQIVDDTQIGTLTMTNTSTWNFYIFAVNQNFRGVTTFYSKQRVYYCDMYNNGLQTRNLIPALRNSDNKPGLYDTINNIFYTNQGTGEFLYA